MSELVCRKCISSSDWKYHQGPGHRLRFSPASAWMGHGKAQSCADSAEEQDPGRFCAVDALAVGRMQPCCCSCSSESFSPTAHRGCHRLLQTFILLRVSIPLLLFLCPPSDPNSWKKNGVDFFLSLTLFCFLCTTEKEENIMKANVSHFGGVKITFKSSCKEYFTFLPHKLIFYLFFLF